MRNCWVFILAIFGCETAMSPEEVFQAAQDKFYEADEVSFSHEMLWENPNLGEVDTVLHQLIFQKNPNTHYDYNYIAKRATYELSYLDDILISVNHKDSTHTLYSEETDWDYENRAGSNSFLEFSPVNLLKKDPWIYIQDTVINQKKYLNFFRVDMDTTIGDKKIYLENHLFINPANLLVERYSRRLYHNGSRSQLIESQFSNYNMGVITDTLQAIAPRGYLSVLSGDKKRETSKKLAAGEPVPDFKLQDLQGNSVRLSSLKGKRYCLTSQ